MEAIIKLGAIIFSPVPLELKSYYNDIHRTVSFKVWNQISHLERHRVIK